MELYHSAIKFVVRRLTRLSLYSRELVKWFLKTHGVDHDVEPDNKRQLFRAIISMQDYDRVSLVNNAIFSFGVLNRSNRYIFLLNINEKDSVQLLHRIGKTKGDILNKYLYRYVSIYEDKINTAKNYAKISMIYPLNVFNELRVYGQYIAGVRKAYTEKGELVRVLAHKPFVLIFAFKYSKPILMVQVKKGDHSDARYVAYKVLSMLGLNPTLISTPKVFVKDIMSDLLKWCTLGYAAIEVRSENLGKKTYSARRKGYYYTNVMNDPKAKREIEEAIEKEQISRAHLEVIIDDKKKKLPFKTIYFSVHLKNIPRIRVLNMVDEESTRKYALDKVIELIIGGKVKFEEGPTILDYIK